MQQASSFWQRWTSPASTSNANSSASTSAIQPLSSPISELNATSDPTSDQNDDISQSKDTSSQVGLATKTYLSPIDHMMTKENSRHNSTSSGSSHQTFSSIPAPSDRQSPVQNAAVIQQEEERQQQLQQQTQQQMQQQQQQQQRNTIGTSAAASNSNEDFFFDRDPLLLPRRNHTIGAGTTPNRKRIHSHFLFPSERPTSPGQNSLSAITGGKDTDDDEWEKMIKSREDLIPGEDDDLTNDARGYTGGAVPWQTNTSLAAASHHRRFDSQPSSVRAVSPYYSGNHSPLDSRGSYHQRSESARVRPLEQGPFASASTASHSPEGRFANLDPGMIRRHQSLNYATGRAMSGRMQGSTRRNLYADRMEDLDRISPTASLTRDANVSPEQQGSGAYALPSNMTPADRSTFAGSGLVSPEVATSTLGSSPSTSTMLSTSLLEAHARLSRMTLQPNTSQQPMRDTSSREPDTEGKRQLHSLVTSRDMLDRSTAYNSQGLRRDIGGPVSASAYVPPIGHGHHRRDDSSPINPAVPMPRSDDLAYRPPISTLQGPFSALPSNTPWAHQGSSLLNKPSMMGNHHLETAREESPRMHYTDIDTSQRSTRDDYNQNNADTMAMNIALLQQRMLSQQQQHHHHQMPTTHMLQQQHHQQSSPLAQHHNLPSNPLHYSMTDPRQPGHLTTYNGLPMEGQPFRTYSPQLPNNPLQSMFQPAIHTGMAAKGPQMQTSQTISPALAAQIAEKGYNPTPAQFDVTAPRARFFVIKSFTEDDVQRSLKHEIWASTEKGNQRLDRAYKECVADGDSPLYLFYSVNASGHFCGMAQMISPLDYSSTSNVWVQEGKWKGTFKVKWIFVKDVPNVKMRHIRLTNTAEQKPVTQSRDTQELPTEGGREILRIMAEYQSKTTLLQDWLFYEQQAAVHQQRKEGPSNPSS